jgi:hypothetical protein
MELQHLNVKIPVEGELTVDPGAFIAIFQQWVKEQHREELLIDMADYRHVPNGPGVMGVGLEADYAMDHQGGRWGLLYNRKAPVAGTNGDRFAQALRSAAAACEKLEADVPGGALRFSRIEFDVCVNDRALAVNSDEDWTAFEPEVRAFIGETLGRSEFSVNRQSEDPRSRLGASIRLAQPLDFAMLAAAAVSRS